MSSRSLTKIYDAIDNQNYKQGLKFCDAILKKTNRDDDMVSAMKALIVVRMGKSAEGLAICKEVVDRGADSPEGDVLNMLMHVYKSAGRIDLAAPAYEAAWAKDPMNEDHATGVFTCHARSHAFGPQQMVAMKMYKAFDEERYLMWAVVSLLLQVKTGGDARLLNMAEMLMRRADLLKQKPVPPEVCDLLLAVLEARGNMEAVLKEIQDGGLLHGSLQPDSDRLNRVAGCHTALAQHGKSLAVYLKLIEANPDDWSYLCGYLASYFAVNGGVGDGTAAPAEEVLTFLRSLQETQSAQKAMKRGPFLAELEYEFLLAKGSDPAAAPKQFDKPRIARVVDLITAYFTKFGSKPCCFDDIKKYAMLIEGSGVESTLVISMQGTIAPQVAEWVAQDKASEAAAWKFICLCRISLTLGVSSVLALDKIPAADTSALGKALEEADSRPMTPGPDARPMTPGSEPEPEPEEAAAGARAARAAKLSGSGDIGGLTRLYFRSLDTLRTDIEDTELRVSDRVLVLIACLLYDRYLAGGARKMCFLVEGVALLREGLKRSPYNFKLKLLLFLLYLELGSFTDAWELWKTLNIRHIQSDTLLYLILPAALRSGNYGVAGEVCSRAASFYQENERDVPEQIVNAYQHNYSNVLDFVHLQTRIRTSYGKLQTQAVSVMVDLATTANGLEKESALQTLDTAAEQGQRANAGSAWLPHSDEVLQKLWQNSDLTVLEFLDGTQIASDAARQLDPAIEQKRASLSLAVLVPHILRAALKEDTPVATLQELLPSLIAGGGAPLVALREAAGGEGEVDWAKTMGALSPEDSEIAVEGAVVCGLLEIMIVLRGFADTKSDDLAVPTASLALLGALPVHLAEALLSEATAGGINGRLVGRVSSMVRWGAVVPALVFQCCAGVLPSKKAKKSKHEKGAPARNQPAVTRCSCHTSLSSPGV